jgi:hypothetical protein
MGERRRYGTETNGTGTRQRKSRTGAASRQAFKEEMMAKKTNTALPTAGRHMSTNVDEVENGFVVHVSGDHGGRNPSFFSKRYVAHSRPQAFRIAAAHHFGTAKGGKKGSKKKTGLAKA